MVFGAVREHTTHCLPTFVFVGSLIGEGLASDKARLLAPAGSNPPTPTSKPRVGYAFIGIGDDLTEPRKTSKKCMNPGQRLSPLSQTVSRELGASWGTDALDRDSEGTITQESVACCLMVWETSKDASHTAQTISISSAGSNCSKVRACRECFSLWNRK